MSKTGFIDVKMNNSDVEIEVFLNSFLNFGWSINIEDKIWYTPLGDNDDFNWVTVNMLDYEEVLGVLKKKQKNGELISIVLTFSSSGHGIDMIIYPMLEKITFGLHRNRKVLFTVNVTDFSWYIERIIPPLKLLNLNIESLECLEG